MTRTLDQLRNHPTAVQPCRLLAGYWLALLVSLRGLTNVLPFSPPCGIGCLGPSKQHTVDRILPYAWSPVGRRVYGMPGLCIQSASVWPGAAIAFSQERAMNTARGTVESGASASLSSMLVSEQHDVCVHVRVLLMPIRFLCACRPTWMLGAKALRECDELPMRACRPKWKCLSASSWNG